MRFLWVSRERYEEQRAELERTRAELAGERDRNFRLFNWTMWRIGGGVAFDTSILPEQYQPKAAAPAANDAKVTETMRAVRAPGQSRRDIAKFETEAEQDFAKGNIGRRPISKEQVSLISELNKAADAGYAEAGQKAAG
jgi:hypothetical protein